VPRRLRRRGTDPGTPVVVPSIGHRPREPARDPGRLSPRADGSRRGIDVTERTIRIGMLGCGTVGSAVVRMLAEHGDDIAMRAEVRLAVTRVAVRDAGRERDIPVSPQVFTTDASSIVADPDVDVVLELLGGMDPAKELILASFASGKPVVTANKELLANVGRELFDAADAASRDIRFEAAV